jgi:rare lipoprotein A
MGAMLLLAAVSVATPGLAKDSGPSRLGTLAAPSFSDTFASYAATPAAQIAPGAVDVTSLPAADDDTAADAQDIGAGLASWYGPGLAGHHTASGERFDPGELTAAHRSLPFGSKVRVTDERTGRSVVVRINDRGPWARGRVIDLSEAAARQIGLVGSGEAKVSLALLAD